MFDLQLIPSRKTVKFNQQLPFFNWYYPFDTDDDRLLNSSLPLLAFKTLHTQRRAIYIHIPFCETICSFCPFTRGKYSSNVEVQNYVNALLLEIELKRHLIGRSAVDTITVGGGTPSLLSPSQIEALGVSIQSNFDTQNLKEFTFEVETKSVTREKLEAMRSIGVNRVSFGAQTFLESYRKIFSLDASIAQILRASELMNEMFDYTNVDMIYGMAGQSLADLYKDASEALKLQTTTIDFYPLNNLAAQARMYRSMKAAGLQHLSATKRLQYRIKLDEFMREQMYAPISGYSYSRSIGTYRGVVRHSPKFYYHDILYGYHDDAVIGYGSSAISQLPGYNLYNFASRQEYTSGLLDKHSLPFETFITSDCPEKGVIGFPYRGILEKSRVRWPELPIETSAAFNEAIAADLVVDRGATYELSNSGWLCYVNLMYYFMSQRSKEWITRRIKHRIDGGHECEETELTESL